ncbi:MAG TPA: NFACT RNA binding domain-containing protein [Ktedonobacterales bacterium]|nr:NFACT RNA binding domain-containing protein [Ktedonobacterales bacterium]
MPAVDALTLAALADELRVELHGARIDDVIQPTPHAIALQCYGNGRNRWLLATAHPQLARLHLVDQKPRKLVTEPPAFVMLLRKHLEGARIASVRQPRWERIVEMGFGRGPSAADGVATVWLVAEIMGRLSNLVLRGDDGVILGALHPVNAEVNLYRAIVPHAPYRYPPPQIRTIRGETLPRLRGDAVSASDLSDAAQAMLTEGQAEQTTDATASESRATRRKGRRGRREAPTVASLLASQVEGFSRELGREIAARALASPDEPLAADLPWDRIAAEARALAELPETAAWEPTLAYGDESSEIPTAFAVYLPRQYGDASLRACASANEMLATFFHDAEWRVAVESAKRDLRHLLQTIRDRCARKDEALRGELAAIDEAQTLREEADLLLAFQVEIARGQTSVTLENPFGEGTTRTLTLDPRFTAVENANRRYARYHKLQRATSLIPPQIEANHLELARVDQLLTDLALAETPAEIALVRAEVVEAGYLRGAAEKRPQKPAKTSKPPKWAKGGKGNKVGKPAQQPRRPEGGTPLRRESSDGMALLVGKNSRQNEEVTFHQASANDTWLHARGVPGAHVIIRNGGRPVSEATLREAASLAAYYSQSRLAGSVPVDYTEQRYVRHMRGGGPGMVTYERERTLHVAPGDPVA